MALRGKLDATWGISTEDEWYKAASDDAERGEYYDDPTSDDDISSNKLAEAADPGNHATFYRGGYTIDDEFSLTEIGAHENSKSPCGTFHRSNNVCE